MSASPTVEYKSALALAIEAEGRHVRCVPLENFFGPGGKPVPAVAFRVAAKADEDAAVRAAHKYAHEAAGDAVNAAAAAADIDLLGDAKNVEALYRVCFEAEPDGANGWRQKMRTKPDGSGSMSYSAFPSPGWMRKHLSTDQIAHLMNGYIAVRAEVSSGGPDAVDEDQHEALVALCAEHWNDDLPDVVLARFGRPKLTNAFVLLARKLVETRVAREALLEERAAWELERAELIAAAHREPEDSQAEEPKPPAGEVT